MQDQTINNDIDQNLRIMEVVEKELNRRKRDSIFCFSVLMSVISIWVLFIALWEKMGRPIEPTKLTYGVEIIAIVMFLLTKFATKLKIDNLGLNFRNFKATMKRALIISGVITVLMVAAKIIMKEPGEPVFDWSMYTPTYPLTSILQEFLARGFMLSCLMTIYESKGKKHLAVFVSSLVFTTLHLYYGFTFMLGAGLLSVLLGYMYLKDENIWGVSLVHFVFGTLGSILAFV